MRTRRPDRLICRAACLASLFLALCGALGCGAEAPPSDPSELASGAAIDPAAEGGSGGKEDGSCNWDCNKKCCARGICLQECRALCFVHNRTCDAVSTCSLIKATDPMYSQLRSAWQGMEANNVFRDAAGCKGFADGSDVLVQGACELTPAAAIPGLCALASHVSNGENHCICDELGYPGPGSSEPTCSNGEREGSSWTSLRPGTRCERVRYECRNQTIVETGSSQLPHCIEQ